MAAAGCQAVLPLNHVIVGWPTRSCLAPLTLGVEIITHRASARRHHLASLQIYRRRSQAECPRLHPVICWFGALIPPTDHETHHSTLASDATMPLMPMHTPGIGQLCMHDDGAKVCNAAATMLVVKQRPAPDSSLQEVQQRPSFAQRHPSLAALAAYVVIVAAVAHMFNTRAPEQYVVRAPIPTLIAVCSEHMTTVWSRSGACIVMCVTRLICITLRSIIVQQA